jgi:hypothetical protein
MSSRFEVVDRKEGIHLPPEFHTVDKCKRLGKRVDEKGNPVSSTFSGRTYTIVSEATRDLPLSTRIKRAILGIAATIGTLGIALLTSKTVRHLFSGQESIFYGVLSSKIDSTTTTSKEFATASKELGEAVDAFKDKAMKGIQKEYPGKKVFLLKNKRYDELLEAEVQRFQEIRASKTEPAGLLRAIEKFREKVQMIRPMCPKLESLFQEADTMFTEQQKKIQNLASKPEQKQESTSEAKLTVTPEPKTETTPIPEPATEKYDPSISGFVSTSEQLDDAAQQLGIKAPTLIEKLGLEMMEQFRNMINKSSEIAWSMYPEDQQRQIVAAFEKINSVENQWMRAVLQQLGNAWKDVLIATAAGYQPGEEGSRIGNENSQLAQLIKDQLTSGFPSDQVEGAKTILDQLKPLIEDESLKEKLEDLDLFISPKLERITETALPEVKKQFEKDIKKLNPASAQALGSSARQRLGLIIAEFVIFVAGAKSKQ